MEVIQTAEHMRKISREKRAKRKTLGFVPTMGALHEGHLSLVRNCREENDIVVVSVFVNPTQFGPNEDLDKYPRDFVRDRALLEKEGCDYIFYPSVDEMYGEKSLTWVEVEKLPEHLCGLSRPGHFKGVTTVVNKLFNIVDPDTAYFGQKDYQQSVIIRKMVSDLHFGIEIKVLPIVRENDGLALSSRNQYLDHHERVQASILYEALRYAQDRVADGETDGPDLIMDIINFIRKRTTLAYIDYIAVFDPETLEDVSKIDRNVMVALAVYFGKTRLIDNIKILYR